MTESELNKEKINHLQGQLKDFDNLIYKRFIKVENDIDQLRLDLDAIKNRLDELDQLLQETT